MKRQFFGTAASLATLLLMVGCVSDPTGALRGGVDVVELERTYVELDVGASIDFAAHAFDEQGNRLSVLLDVTSSDDAVVTVDIDTVTSLDPLPETSFTVTAVGPGSATITASSGSVTSEATVVSFPTSLAGTPAVAASGMGWDIVTVSAPTGITFDPENTTATINGDPAFIHSISESEVQLVSSNPDAQTDATIELTNLTFLGAYEIPSLETANTVSVSAFSDFMTTSIATAPDVSGGPFPMVFYGMVSAGAPDVIASLSPASTLALETSVFWLDEDTDIDVFYTDAGDGFVDCLGCGGSNPETGSFTITGGDTNYFYVELWSGSPTMFQVTLQEPAP